jgi:hypothetical protein
MKKFLKIVLVSMLCFGFIIGFYHLILPKFVSVKVVVYGDTSSIYRANLSDSSKYIIGETVNLQMQLGAPSSKWKEFQAEDKDTIWDKLFVIDGKTYIKTRAKIISKSIVRIPD